MSNQSDNLDHASETEEAFRAMALRRLQHQERVPSDFDGKTCTECGSDIPERRLALSKFRCVECQESIEKSGKIFVRR